MNEALRNKFLEFITNKSNDVKKNLQYETFSYNYKSKSGENKYTFFPSKLQSNNLVIYVHGGMWINLDLSSSAFLADFFVNNDFNFVAIGYDPCPLITISEMICQVKFGIKAIIENYSNQNVYLIGHSSGAHLILSSLLCDWVDECNKFSSSIVEKLNGIILISGTYDLREIYKSPSNDIWKLTSNESWKVSPLQFVQNICNYRKDLMILILVEENDFLDFQKQSKNIYHELKRFVKEECLHFIIIDEVDHFTIISRLGNPDYQLTNLIIDYIKN